MPQTSNSQLSDSELESLKAEMRRDGLKIRQQLKAMNAPLPLDLPLYVTKAPHPTEKRTGVDLGGFGGP